MAKTNTERFEIYGGDVVVDFYPDSHRYKEVNTKQWIPGATTITGMLDKSRALIGWAIGCFEESLINSIDENPEGIFHAGELKSMINVSKNAHNEIKDIACDIGTVVHDYADNVGAHEIENGNDRSYLKVRNDLIPSEYHDLSVEDQKRADNAMNTFDQWIAEKNPEFLDTEFFVYSKKYHHGGKCDGLVRIDGKIYILDYKTGKAIYTSHLYQVSSYLKAKEEEWIYIGNEIVKVDGAMIINIIKDDVFNTKDELIKQAGDITIHEMSRSDLVVCYKGFKNLLGIYNVEKQAFKMLK